MSAELKAGLFVIFSVLALAIMTTKLTQNQFSLRGTKRYYVKVKDATGLLSKTKVKMAGLDVGQLAALELAGKQARASIDVAADLKLYKAAIF